jgi:hypothetical protein
MIETVGLFSIALIALGCFFIYPPLAALIPGVILLVISCMAAKNLQSEEKQGNK